MQNISLTVKQSSEKFDDKGLNTAVNLAQTKIAQLGVDSFESCTLAFTVGTTTIEFESVKLAEVEEAENE